MCPWVVCVFDLNRVSRSSQGCLVGVHGFLFSHALAVEFDPRRCVRAGQGLHWQWLDDHVVSVIDGHLAGNDGGSLFISVLDDFQEIATLLVVELLRSLLTVGYINYRAIKGFPPTLELTTRVVHPGFGLPEIHAG